MDDYSNPISFVESILSPKRRQPKMGEGSSFINPARIAIGMELHSIEVEKSPFCRYGSECWDVKLKFFDPENVWRAKRVFRFTIDVSDRTPVTLGEVRSWAVSK